MSSTDDPKPRIGPARPRNAIRSCLERLGLTTDCGLINLPRMIAASKLRALADGAAIVREELAGHDK